MNYAALKLDLAAKASGATDPAVAAAAINGQPAVAGLRPLTSAECLAWSGAASRYLKIEAAANATLPATNDPIYPLAVGVKNVARVAQKLIDRDETTFDPRLSDRQQMLGALVDGGVITTADRDDLLALAAVATPYPVATYGVAAITAADVLTAWRQL